MREPKPLRTLVLAALLPLSAFAQSTNMPEANTHDHGGHTMNMSAPATEMTAGEVRKVDKSAAKVTIKHGEIKNLDMGAMTMVFKVKDPAMLDALKAGDKINFTADNMGGALTLTRIEPVK